MRKIFISAGHDNKDSGAVANGFKEAEVVRDFRNLVGFYLDRQGVDYIADGYGDVNIPLKEVVKIIPKNAVAVEFHLNAATPAATGVETLSASKDYELGKKLCEAVSKRLNIRNRGAKPEDAGQHSRLAYVQAGGLILELFFITNKQDLANYQAVKWLLAREVADILVAEASKK